MGEKLGFFIYFFKGVPSYFTNMFSQPQTLSANLVKITSKLNEIETLCKNVTMHTHTHARKAFHNLPTLDLIKLKMQL